jgi:kumamolisin
MAAKSARKPVPGSEKQALPQAKAAGKPDPQEHIEVSVLVRPRADTRGTVEARNFTSAELTSRQYATREALAAERGASPDDIAKVEAFAHDHNLTVVETSISRRTIKLAGSIADLEEAFQPNLKKWKVGSRTFRGRTGAISVPNELANIVVAVLGFDNRPAVKPHLRYRDGAPKVPRNWRASGNGRTTNAKAASSKASSNGKGRVIRPRNAPDGSFKPTEVAKLYNFPAGLDGSGQCIAIIELNDTDNHGNPTGSGFSASDLKAYFQALGVPLPSVVAVGVDGGANKPGPDANSDGEVMLDIEVAGAVAPKASIAVYFAPNTDQGFIDAVTTAVHDNVRKPSVISISWGGPEESWTAQSLTAFDQALQDAAAMGVTVCCAAGDDGSSDTRGSDRDGKPHVDFPAASPFALACGGTKLLGSGTSITSEVVWNEGDSGTGGGVSNHFPRPAYQAHASVPKSPKGKVGRGVPDIAGDADPETGYQVRLVGGQNTVIGGTSAVAPLWAGLVALLNQKLAVLGKPPIGFCNPFLYTSLSHSAAALHDITVGNNDIEHLGKYKAKKGWDPCTGLGTPDGQKLLDALSV